MIKNNPINWNDANNRLTAWNGATLTYDRNGNLIQDTQNSYTWNSRNQLSQISGGTSATFSYDAMNRRTEKKIGTNTTQFLYDGLNFVQEQDGATVKSTLITGGIDEFFGRSENSKTYYPLVDALGTVLALTDDTGKIVTNYSYEAYGKTATRASPSTNSQQYTGRENDGTGLYYYRARYYSPTLQRFVSEDPVGLEGGINFYGYVEGQPTDMIDPLGLKMLPDKKYWPKDPLDDEAKRGKYRFCVNTTNSLESCLVCCADARRPLLERLADQQGGSNCVIKCTDKYKLTRCEQPPLSPLM